MAGLVSHRVPVPWRSTRAELVALLERLAKMERTHRIPFRVLVVAVAEQQQERRPALGETVVSSELVAVVAERPRTGSRLAKVATVQMGVSWLCRNALQLRRS